MAEHKDIIIIGGGAAGFFAAINIAERHTQKSVCILEKGKSGLQKVKISGGGRCNVTHAEFSPSELVEHYPRGKKELLGPFHRFMTGDTVAWFEERGVALKIEEDGRMFPVSDSSQTIIDCFLHQAKKHKVEVLYNQNVLDVSLGYSNNSKIYDAEDGLKGFQITTQNESYTCDTIIFTTGSNPKIWKLLEQLGHSIIPPVPSLFTFDVVDERITDLAGLVVKEVEVKVLGTDLVSYGPLLITHVGMSAPAILKLSAFGARELANRNYNFDIKINFINQLAEACTEQLKHFKLSLAKKTVKNYAQFDLPKRLWERLVSASGIKDHQKWADINKHDLSALAVQLTQAEFHITGKSTFKEEFVTSGGVDLKDINFRTFESNIIPNLYLAGEILNIDAVTGGFNFQNAWTGAYIAALAIN